MKHAHADAVYAIEVAHDPHSENLPWDARVRRLSDDWPMTMTAGATRDDALAAAREWIAREYLRATEQEVVLVDEQGVPIEPGELHSVKA